MASDGVDRQRPLAQRTGRAPETSPRSPAARGSSPTRSAWSISTTSTTTAFELRVGHLVHPLDAVANPLGLAVAAAVDLPQGRVASGVGEVDHALQPFESVDRRERRRPEHLPDFRRHDAIAALTTPLAPQQMSRLGFCSKP
jgi:hypothetical protein